MRSLPDLSCPTGSWSTWNAASVTQEPDFQLHFIEGPRVADGLTLQLWSETLTVQHQPVLRAEGKQARAGPPGLTARLGHVRLGWWASSDGGRRGGGVQDPGQQSCGSEHQDGPEEGLAKTHRA